jgi:hypothetical protein
VQETGASAEMPALCAVEIVQMACPAVENLDVEVD